VGNLQAWHNKNAGRANMFGRIAAACILIAVVAAPAAAQDYPNRPIRIVVPFGPGGGGDIIGRIFGQSLQEKLGQPVVIENKPGAAGTLGNELISRADKDGYTIGVMTAGQIIAAVMNKGLRYDTATAFEPISQVGTASLMLVARADFPASTVDELIAVAKASPGKINVASPGFGATQHMSGELFKQMAGIDMLSVQFRTTPEAVTAVLGKQVDVLFDTVLAVVSQVKSGQLKAIAVTTKDRFPIVPDVPSIAESRAMTNYDVATWYGFFGPRGIPGNIVAKLNRALNEALNDPSVREKLINAGVTPKGSTPEGFGTFMADELARWTKVRDAAGIAAQ
jgi:tripartite-type tricarboxylate transporter receptor subunit TctC